MKRLLILCIVIAILLSGCGDGEEAHKMTWEQSMGSVGYRIIHIEGMPCVKIYYGISCDWSKWEGE